MATRRQSYWATIREVREQHGLSLREARAFWRLLRDYTERVHGRRPYATDLARHPRVSKRLADEARTQVMAPPPAPPAVAPPPPLPPPPWEFEITATTKGQTPRQRK